MSDDRLGRAIARFTEDWSQYGYGLAIIQRASSVYWTAIGMVAGDKEVACATSPDLATAVEGVLAKLERFIDQLRASAEKEER